MIWIQIYYLVLQSYENGIVTDINKMEIVVKIPQGEGTSNTCFFDFLEADAHAIYIRVTIFGPKHNCRVWGCLDFKS